MHEEEEIVEREDDEIEDEEEEVEVEDDPYYDNVIRPQRHLLQQTFRSLNRGIQYKRLNLKELL